MPPTDAITQAGIDRANAAVSNVDRDEPFALVKQILDGQASQRQQRGAGALDVCDAVAPGNTIVDSNHPALVVAISPNGHEEGLEQASSPNVVTNVGAVQYINVLQPNPSRKRLLIQNNGTTGIYIVLGKASTFLQTPAQQASPFTLYHVKLTPNGTYVDELWRGRVDIVSDGANGVAAISEYWRATNPT